ncbi:hypothetical protein J7643_18435 [bacterium]|nr:hypothetical protein [bacterium]
MKSIAWVFAVLAIASAGCDKIGPVFGLAGEPAKPRATGAIKGKVVDRNGKAIAGAKVSNGAALYYTSDGEQIVRDDLWRSTMSDEEKAKHTLTLGEGEFVLTKVAANTITLVRAEFDGNFSPAVQIYVDAKTFDNTKDEGAPTVLDDEIKVPAYGPVDRTTRKNALEYVASTDTLNGTPAASPSTSVTFDNGGKVTLRLKAPPGSDGTAVKSYKITYYPVEADLSNLAAATPISTEVGDGLLNNPISRSLATPVLIPPATQTRSGSPADVPLNIVTTDASFSAYVRAKSELKAYVELFDANGAILERDTTTAATISTTVSIRLRE